MSDAVDWDRALGWALTGRDHPDWTPTDHPDPDRVVGRLVAAGVDADALRASIAGHRRAGDRWPHPVPDRLRQGIGAAQFAAALSELRQRLTAGAATAAPVVSERPPDADEQRLLRDVPPHY